MNSGVEKTEYTFSRGIKDCVPTIVGYLSVGFACGIVGAASGFSVFAMALLAILVYAGAGQFIICALVGTATPISAIILTIFVVNSRHLLMCASLAPTFKKYSLAKNIRLGLLITDEAYGVAMNKIIRNEPITDKWMTGVTIGAYVSWIFGCITGALCGQWIPDPYVLGLDFSLAAMFVALLWSQLQPHKGIQLKRYLLLASIVSASMFFFSFFFETYLAVLFATIVGATAGMNVCDVKKKEKVE